MTLPPDAAPRARHAHPFRLIDRVIEAGGACCTAFKAITTGEHPGPEGENTGDYPAALVVEALAQAALPLAGGATGVLVGMDRVRLHRPVVPGDTLTITATVSMRLGGLVRVASRAEVAGVLVAEGEFTMSEGLHP
ncbi:MAG: 3-hydroxyacyl-ACP dehydratase FabZ [Candidatus Polarisedimenticolia bacterium]